jgi:hypothetical protein
MQVGDMIDLVPRTADPKNLFGLLHGAAPAGALAAPFAVSSSALAAPLAAQALVRERALP